MFGHANNLILDAINSIGTDQQITDFLDALPFSSIITDAGSGDTGPLILYSNPATTILCGYEPEELYGKTPKILHGPGTDLEAANEFRKMLELTGCAVGVIMNYRKDGSPYMALLNGGKIQTTPSWKVNGTPGLRVVIAQDLGGGMSADHTSTQLN